MSVVTINSPTDTLKLTVPVVGLREVNINIYMYTLFSPTSSLTPHECPSLTPAAAQSYHYFYNEELHMVPQTWRPTIKLPGLTHSPWVTTRQVWTSFGNQAPIKHISTYFESAHYVVAQEQTMQFWSCQAILYKLKSGQEMFLFTIHFQLLA